MKHKQVSLVDAVNKLGELSALLARYRALLADAASIDAPSVKYAIADLRRAAAELECLAIGLAQASLGNECSSRAGAMQEH